MYPSMAVRNDEIAVGATLSPGALRKLFRDSAEQLHADWDNLPAESWSHAVRTAQGREVPATATVWMRSRELWVHAVDLNNGADFEDLPEAALNRLLDDITDACSTRDSDVGLRIEVTDDDGAIRERYAQDGDTFIVSGGRAAIAQWASGRGTFGVTARALSALDGAPLQEVPPAPAWL